MVCSCCLSKPPPQKAMEYGCEAYLRRVYRFRNQGRFLCVRRASYDFSCSSLFREKIGPYLYRLYGIVGKMVNNPQQSPIRTNKSMMFRAISNFLVNLTLNPFCRTPQKAEGYTFIRFKKAPSLTISVNL